MTIVERSDYTMLIMKDSEDPFWFSISSFRKKYEEGETVILQLNDSEDEDEWFSPESILCTGGRMMLYFKDRIPDDFRIGAKVKVKAVKLR